MIRRKILNYFLQNCVFFKDGSEIEYFQPINRLRYVSPSGSVTVVPLKYKQDTRELKVDIPADCRWIRPTGNPLSSKEMIDLTLKVSAFVAEQGKPFVQ